MNLELLVFLGGRKTWNLLASGGALDLHADLFFILRPGFAKDDYGI